MRHVVLSAALCAALVMFVHAGVAAQTHTAACSTIGAMLGGSGTFKGVNEYAQADAKDVRDTKTSQAALQTYLAAAHKNLVAAVAIGDRSRAAQQRVIIARLDSTVASNKRLLATSTATLDLTQQQQRTLRQQAATRHCTNLGYQALPPPATGSGSTTSGTIDLAGSWVMHLHGAFDEPVEYYVYDAVLTGPPGGPWHIETTLRQSTMKLPNPEPIGHVISMCSLWLTGPTSVERRCPYLPGQRPAGATGEWEIVQPGSIAGDRITLSKMNGIPASPYGEMRRGTYQR